MKLIKMTFERKTKLKNLVKLMNQQNERHMPAVKPLLEMMNMVLSSEELDYLIKLGITPYTYEQAAEIANMTESGFKTFFDTLGEKGFIRIKYNESGERQYILNAILVGWIEAQIPYLMGKPQEKEFAKKMYVDLINYGKKFTFFPLRNLQNIILKSTLKSNQSVGIVEFSKESESKTVIDVKQTIAVNDSKICTTRTVNDLIEEYGNNNMIAQLPCMCRHSYKILNDPCRFKFPEHGGCIGFGDMIKPYVEYGHARYISKQEAFDIIQEVRDKGAVHSMFHQRDDTNLSQVGFCNCCWDCCGLFRSYNQGAAALKYKCFYMANIIDKTSCTGCKRCEKYCPTTAAAVIDKKVVINQEKCIGCGQCKHQCPEKSVIELIRHNRHVFLPILKKNEIRIH